MVLVQRGELGIIPTHGSWGAAAGGAMQKTHCWCSLQLHKAMAHLLGGGEVVMPWARVLMMKE